MFSGNRLYYVAFGGCLAGLLCIGGLLAKPPENIEQTPTNEAHEYQATQPGQTESQPSISGAVDRQTPAESDQSASDDRYYYPRKDLIAQQRMAEATDRIVEVSRWQVKIAVGGLVLGALTVWFAWWAAHAASRAAKAAEDTVTEARSATKVTEKSAAEARRNARRELRAYTSLTPNGIQYNALSEKLAILVTQKNDGQTPAKEVRFSGIAGVFQYPLPDDFKFPKPKFDEGVNVIAPSHGFSVSVPYDGAVNEVALGAIHTAKTRIYFIGTLTYRDIFGKSRETLACWSYPNTEMIEVIRRYKSAAAQPRPTDLGRVDVFFHYTNEHNSAT